MESNAHMLALEGIQSVIYRYDTITCRSDKATVRINVKRTFDE